MPIRQAEAGGSVVNNCIRCEGSAFRKGTALLLVSLPADSTTVAFFLVKYNENRGGAQQKKPSNIREQLNQRIFLSFGVKKCKYRLHFDTPDR